MLEKGVHNHCPETWLIIRSVESGVQPFQDHLRNLTKYLIIGFPGG